MDDRRSDAIDVELSRAFTFMLIEELLQARATLCGVGDRLGSVRRIEWMRAQRRSLVDRLEDMVVRSVASFIALSEFTLNIPPSASGNSPCGGE